MQSVKKFVRNFLNRLILCISFYARIDLLYLAHRECGILRGGNFRTTGEMRFIAQDLHTLVSHPEPVFFDVGANVGNYSVFLRSVFPSARIFSFEPNPMSFKKLTGIAKPHGILIFNSGLSSSSGETDLFLYATDDTTERASVYEGALKEFFNFDKPSKIKTKLIRLDDFCHKHDVNNIDFLKIDTEGHELEVLKGAGGMLASGAIGIVQFEFSMNNVVSRVFLKNFYDLMPRYDFYRIRQSGLLPLGPYNPTNEIFVIHNLVAILKK